jgi:hypothetical protein
MAVHDNDPLSQAEKRRVVLQDADVRRRQQDEASTLHARAVAEASQSLGRFDAMGKPHVTGSTPIPQYPAAGAHQSDPVPAEPPLGFPVDAMPTDEPSTAFPVVEQTGDPVDAPSTGMKQDHSPEGSVSDSAAGSSPSSEELVIAKMTLLRKEEQRT